MPQYRVGYFATYRVPATGDTDATSLVTKGLQPAFDPKGLVATVDDPVLDAPAADAKPEADTAARFMVVSSEQSLVQDKDSGDTTYTVLVFASGVVDALDITDSLTAKIDVPQANLVGVEIVSSVDLRAEGRV